MPGDIFLPAAYFCGKDGQVRIPQLEVFLEKIASLAGVGTLGTATNAVVKSPNAMAGSDLGITKADFANGTYKICSGSDNQRCVYVANTTLENLRGIAKPLIGLYSSLDCSAVKEAFEKSVATVTTIAELLECTDYQVLETEMYQSNPPDVNMNLFSETIVNFRNYFYRQVRRQLQSQ